jgi:anti-sigma B factor antagonist
VLTIERPDAETLALAGELDIVGADELRAAIDPEAIGAEEVHLDLGGLEFLDSTGLASLIDLARAFHAAGTRLRTTSPPGSEARLVIGMSGLAPQLGMDEQG